MNENAKIHPSQRRIQRIVRFRSLWGKFLHANGANPFEEALAVREEWLNRSCDGDGASLVR